MSRRDLRRRLVDAEKRIGAQTWKPSLSETVKALQSGVFAPAHVEKGHAVVSDALHATLLIGAVHRRLRSRDFERYVCWPMDVSLELIAFPRDRGGGLPISSGADWFLQSDPAEGRLKQSPPLWPRLYGSAAILHRHLSTVSIGVLVEQVDAIENGELIKLPLPVGEPYRRAERLADALRNGVIDAPLCIPGLDAYAGEEVDNAGQLRTLIGIRHR